MTTLSQLSISGIRSYSHERSEVIRFFSPLTIIVGANGSGKTTVIEALKYASTGQHPPLSDGGKSFVHDPKVEGVPVIKGKIMLGFRTAMNKPVVAIRSFQCTQKKHLRSYKALDGTLRTRDANGKEVRISQKCSEMAKQVPMLLGVSTAVLENVIFCHQEDSNWPLSESKVLKNKFDDIFAATKYTKALELIRKLRTAKLKEIKDMQLEKAVLEQNVSHVRKLEGDLNTVKETLAEKKQQREALVTKAEQLQREHDELMKHEKASRALKREVGELEQRRTFMIEEMTKADDAAVPVYTESDQELRTYLSKFENTLYSQKDDIESRQSRMKEVERFIARKQSEYQNAMKRIGGLEAGVAAHRAKQASLVASAKRLAEKHGVDALQQIGGDGGVDAATAFKSFQKSLEATQSDQRHALDAAQKKGNASDAKFEAQILFINSQLTKAKAQLNNATRRLNENDKSLADVRRKQKNVQHSINNLSGIQDAIAEAERALATFTQQHNTDAMSSEMADINAAVATCNTNMSILSGERKKLSSQSEQLHALKFQRTQLADLQRALKNKWSDLRNSIEVAAVPGGVEIPEESRPLVLQQRLARKAADGAAERDRASTTLRTVRAKHVEKTSILGTVVSKLDASHKDTNRLNNEFASARITTANFVAKLARKQEQYDKAQFDIRMMVPLGDLYSNFVELAQSQNKCAVCDRDFETSSDKKAFIGKNKAIIKTSKERVEEGANSNQYEERLRELKALSSSHEHALRLEVEVPQLEAQRTALTAEVATLAAEVTQKEAELAAAEKAVASLASLSTLVAEVLRLHEQAVAQQTKVDAEEERVRALAASLSQSVASASVDGSVRSLDDVNAEYERQQIEAESLNKRLMDVQSRLSTAMTRQQELRENRTRLTQKGSDCARLTTELQALSQQEKELVTSNEQYADRVKQAQGILSPLQDELQSQQQQREEQRRKHAAQETKVRDLMTATRRDIDSFASSAAELRKLSKDAEDGDDVRISVESAKASMDEKTAELKSLRVEVDKVRDNILATTKVVHDVKATMKYRERKAEVVALDDTIASKRAELRAATGRDDISESLASVSSSLSNVGEKRAELRGVINTLKNRRSDIQTDLSAGKYKNIDERFKSKLIEHQTHTMAAADMDKYAKALDRALMQFHAQKMKEINETVKEYWRSTYKGNDIDEVYILSQPEIDGAKRKYNYRVVMRQGDTELDMRGRCSAGQKVLASLIIRLALAETFCVNCGVLALDEPTTNLDQKNSTAFAKALNLIVEKRSKQKNFQLIVITHNEEFVEHLRRRENADFYYRVFKDDNQRSKITCQPIND